MKTIAAFFDIDGTIFRNSLMIEHFKKLMKYEILDPALWYNKIKPVFEEWDKRYGDFDDYLDTLSEVYIEGLKGVNKSFIEFIAAHVINLNGDMVYRYSRERIRWHQKNGHKVFLYLEALIFWCQKWQKNMGLQNTEGQHI